MNGATYTTINSNFDIEDLGVINIPPCSHVINTIYVLKS